MGPFFKPKLGVVINFVAVDILQCFQSFNRAGGEARAQKWFGKPQHVHVHVHVRLMMCQHRSQPPRLLSAHMIIAYKTHVPYFYTNLQQTCQPPHKNLVETGCSCTEFLPDTCTALQWV